MISEIDYRHRKGGFFGLRLYMSKQPDFIIQRYYSYRENGKFISKKRQKALLKDVQEIEVDLKARIGIDGRRGLFKKVGNVQIGKRECQQPCRLAGMNISLQRNAPKTQNIHWVDLGNDIHFKTYAPVIVLWRGKHQHGSLRYPFRSRHEFFQAYAQAFEAYVELYDVTEEEKARAMKLRPPWKHVRPFVLTEAVRLYEDVNFELEFAAY